MNSTRFFRAFSQLRSPTTKLVRSRYDAGVTLELQTLRPPTNVNVKDRPLVFVHGGFHGAWCWQNFMQYFSSQGYECHALSLRHHGASMPAERNLFSTAEQFVEDVHSVVLSLGRDVKPALVGHSAGTGLVQLMLSHHGASVHSGVLLAPFPPTGGASIFVNWFHKHPVALLKGALMMDPAASLATPQLFREIFLASDTTNAEAEVFQKQAEPAESLLWPMKMCTRYANPKSIKNPIAVIGASEDVLMTPAVVHRVASAYGVQARIVPGVAHDLMLDKKWRLAADATAAALKDNGV
eukprot:TRINITY_DN12755_c0_g1_i1.p1 TRINITY_DN12755_c0_g1~~TRINITY_DN12755_c0_g1_i1.p1  ORF type:complete len:296 (+),score=65.54 TRINITY_DN12755_c0_g1_i1:81-968(+)